MPDLLSDRDLEDALKKIPMWDRKGDSLQRVLEFDDFMEGIDFVNLLADVAEEARHHPDIDIRYRRITLNLTTHDAGGLTEADLELARRIDHLAD